MHTSTNILLRFTQVDCEVSSPGKKEMKKRRKKNVAYIKC